MNADLKHNIDVARAAVVEARRQVHDLEQRLQAAQSLLRGATAQLEALKRQAHGATEGTQ